MESARTVLANVVVVGQFNPGIVTPQWMVDNRVEADGQVTAELRARGPGVGYASYTMATVRWEAHLDRLIVESTEGSLARAARVVRDILHHLPHTPVMGVGRNLHYEFVDGCADIVEPCLQVLDGCTPSLAGKVHQRGFRQAWALDGDLTGTNLLMDYIEKEEKGFLNLNFHTEVSDAKAASVLLEKDELETLAQARQLCNYFTQAKA